jgi:hypothetical protein
VARTAVSSAKVAMVVGRLKGPQYTWGIVTALGHCLGVRQRGLETGS